jgi:hypothetical protein
MKAQLCGDRAFMQQHRAGKMLQRSRSVLTRCCCAPLRPRNCLTSASASVSSSRAGQRGQRAQYGRAPFGAGASAGAAAPWKLQLSSHGAISRGAFGNQIPWLGSCRAAGDNRQHASRIAGKALPSRSTRTVLHACTFVCAYNHGLCTIQLHWSAGAFGMALRTSMTNHSLAFQMPWCTGQGQS